MAPKGRNRNEDLKQEDVLQAVVIADSFNTRFAPITKKKPRALLPLVNVPLIDYTLEALEASGVQEVFVFCCHLGELIREHIRNSKWQKEYSSMTVTTIMSESCLSVGDALREIEAKSLIRSDFILIFGDTVANMNFKKVVAEHKARVHGKDKSSVMTLLFKVANPGHRARDKEEDVFLTEEGGSGRLLFFKRTRGARSIQLPSNILLDHSDLITHNDLMDCHVCVCSSIVPTLFTDNFDYLTVDDFVRGILINEEIMGNKIHVSVTRDQYAARVFNLKTYDSISKDVITRWTYPYVPDLFGHAKGERVKYGRHNIYCSDNVDLARGCELSHNVVVGEDTCIKSGTTVTNCVIGKNCKIGCNVSLKNCFLWDNVTVDDGCSIDTALLCSGVHLLNNVNVLKGAIIAWDVVVGPDVTIEKGTRLMSEPQRDDFDDDMSFDDDDDDKKTQEKDLSEEKEEADSKAQFGINSQAYVYTERVDSDEEEDESPVVESKWGVSDDSDGKFSDEDDEEDDDSNDDSLDGEDGDDVMLDSEDEVDRSLGFEPSDWMAQHKPFYTELIDTFERAISEGISNDNLILEINSLKHAYTVEIETLIKSLPCAIIHISATSVGSKLSADAQAMNSCKKNAQKFSAVLSKYIKDVETQLYTINGCGDFIIRHEDFRPRFPQILNIIYDADIIDEGTFMKWAKSSSKQTSDDVKRHAFLSSLAQPFITWLEEAEEESEEEEGDTESD